MIANSKLRAITGPTDRATGTFSNKPVDGINEMISTVLSKPLP
jgi:hypothetical protein